MAVRIRMKRMGRRHRPFYRLCAVDSRAARDGRVIEYLGHYDPMLSETDARAVLNRERIDYWLGVGAQPSEKCRVLIKKYGTDGTHLQQQQAALERIAANRPAAPPPAPVSPAEAEPEAEQAPAEAEQTQSDEAEAEAAAASAGEETAQATEGESSEKNE